MTPTLNRLKKPFGTAKMVDLTAVHYLAWEDAFEVDFEDGLSLLRVGEVHEKISSKRPFRSSSGGRIARSFAVATTNTS